MSFILENIFIILIALISGAMLAWPALSRTRGVKGVDIAEATRLVNHEHAVFIDVRSADDYAKGHIPQARSLPLEQIDARAQSLPKNKPLIVVCADGRTAGRAVTQLQAKGLAQAVALRDGMKAWSAANLPLSSR